MNREIPLEIPQLRRRLLDDFEKLLPEANSGCTEERERNLLSRSLAAFTIQQLSKCSIKEAANSLVDGRNDGGIDAVYYDRKSFILYIVQSKFIANGNGEPALDDVSKFKNGLEYLLKGQFDRFDGNDSWLQKFNTIRNCFENPLLQVRAVLTYTSFKLVSDDRLWLFEDLKNNFCQSELDNYFTFRPCNLTTLHDWITGADQGPGVPVIQLKLLNTGFVLQPYETFYGLISLEEIARLHEEHGNKLVGANIRYYRGDTEVNQHILDTVQKEPQHLFYLNNGLTAYCQRLEVHHLDRANHTEKNITAYGFSIVNGAQTLGSVTKHFNNTGQNIPEGYIFLKVISLKGCEDDRAFAERITRSTNFQNQVGVRDFVALDEQQERIAKQLVLSNIHYHYKERHDMPPPDESNFTLDEATTACACLVQSSDCDIVSRIIYDKPSLWSKEPIYPQSDLNSSPYSRIFTPDRSARSVWRAVQTQRLVLETMGAKSRSKSKRQQDFVENAAWIVLNILFLKLHPENGNDLALSESLKTDIRDKTLEIVEVLMDACLKYEPMQSIFMGYDYYFSEAEHCSALRKATITNQQHEETET